MIIYWTGCIASILLAYLGCRNARGRSIKGAVSFFSALPMILIAALRYDVGQDYLYTYVPYFEKVANNMVNDSTRLEYAYHLLNKLVVLMNGDFIWVFVICSFLFFCFTYAHIFYDSPQPGFSIFLLVGMNYLFVFYNAMRQMVGCAILLFSIRYIRKRRLIPFMLCVILAAGFHASCAAFAIAYWFARIKIKPLWALILSAAVVLGDDLIAQFIRFVASLTPYNIYFASIYDTGQTAYVMLAINAVLLCFAGLFYQDSEKYRMYFNFQLAATWITYFSGKIVLFLRFMWMFGLTSIILLPMAVEQLPKERDRKLLTALMVLMYVLYTTYTVGVQNSNSVLPYQSIFSRWI